MEQGCGQRSTASGRARIHELIPSEVRGSVLIAVPPGSRCRGALCKETPRESFQGLPTGSGPVDTAEQTGEAGGAEPLQPQRSTRLYPKYTHAGDTPRTLNPAMNLPGSQKYQKTDRIAV